MSGDYTDSDYFAAEEQARLQGDRPMPTDNPRVTIPRREEIEAEVDYKKLWELLDDIEDVIVDIETCLAYPGDSGRDWFFRARSALICFRIGRRQVEKRLKVLEKSRPGPAVVAFAPEV